MRVFATIAEARAVLDEARRRGGRTGLVPTMGFLHDGHRALIDRSVVECDATLVTIFVNPLQFAPTDDLDAYPRDLGRDVAICEAAGATAVLAPAVAEMYPAGVPVLTSVAVAALSTTMEGVSRPGHFAGVATVVAKLFNIAGPCRSYFGEKDWQQLAVVTRMAADLSFPVEVVGCPTVREPDGLALSSRNVYLSTEERAAAPVLYRALRAGAAAIEAGARSQGEVRAVVRDVVAAEPLAELDYAAVVDAATLGVFDPLVGDIRLLVAGRFGRARLIDNVGATARP
ncbi:MAG: pantoate--beta-alanine ligase [Acidimicrobiia bacterium]